MAFCVHNVTLDCVLSLWSFTPRVWCPDLVCDSCLLPPDLTPLTDQHSVPAWKVPGPRQQAHLGRLGASLGDGGDMRHSREAAQHTASIVGHILSL